MFEAEKFLNHMAKPLFVEDLDTFADSLQEILMRFEEVEERGVMMGRGDQMV